jgi:hypothetical protein
VIEDNHHVDGVLEMEQTANTRNGRNLVSEQVMVVSLNNVSTSWRRFYALILKSFKPPWAVLR